MLRLLDFNSTIVRLKLNSNRLNISINDDFNSTIVRLKLNNCFNNRSVFINFNSTIVRLKLGSSQFLITPNRISILQ